MKTEDWKEIRRRAYVERPQSPAFMWQRFVERLAAGPQTEAYFKKLAAQSDRLRLVDIGRTEEGRTQWMVVASDPANLYLSVGSQGLIINADARLFIKVAGTNLIDVAITGFLLINGQGIAAQITLDFSVGPIAGFAHHQRVQ